MLVKNKVRAGFIASIRVTIAKQLQRLVDIVMCHTNYSYDMIGQGSKDDESRSSSERPGVKTFFNQGEMLLQLCFRFMKCAINNFMPGIIIIRVGLCSLIITQPRITFCGHHTKASNIL